MQRLQSKREHSLENDKTDSGYKQRKMKRGNMEYCVIKRNNV